MEWVRQPSEGLACLSKEKIDAVLLELGPPDSHGIAALNKLIAVPEVSMIPGVDEALGKQAVEGGAQDYLVAGHLDSYSLSRALLNVIQRKTVEDASYAEKERAVVTLNSIADAVLSTDILSNITDLNLVAETMIGWGKEEGTSKPLAELFRIINGIRAQTALEIRWRWLSSRTGRRP